MSFCKRNAALAPSTIAHFHTLRERLLGEPAAERLDKPLAYWALPTDRRLPVVFMQRTVRELVETPFDRLFATPGIGAKKISGLIDLLDRAAGDELPGAAAPTRAEDPVGAADPALAAVDDPANVSEALWSAWRARLQSRGLGREPLGRFAASLQNLPRVVWSTPLEFYASRSLEEIRRLKTHGEKRVRAVLEVFRGLVSSLADAPGPEHLAARIQPRFARELEGWLRRVALARQLPALAEMETRFVLPLVRQVELDGGPAYRQLAELRLGLAGPRVSVRQTARQMDVTRARVYQLFEDLHDMLRVRWPEAPLYVRPAWERWNAWVAPDAESDTFRLAVGLFFPEVARLPDEADEAEPVRPPVIAARLQSLSSAAAPALGR